MRNFKYGDLISEPEESYLLVFLNTFKGIDSYSYYRCLILVPSKDWNGISLLQAGCIYNFIAHDGFKLYQKKNTNVIL